MKSKSPLARSMARLRDLGYLVEKTEHWNAFSRRRVDFLGFADAIAIRGDEVLAVQATSGSNVSARVKKLIALPNVAIWLASPHRKLVVEGWAKRGPRGKRKLWSNGLIEITPDQLTNDTPKERKAQ